MKHPIDVAADLLGSQAALATALGVTRAAVTQWKDDGRRTPAEHCPLIERLTNGIVTCEQLRPDMAWGVIRGSVAAPKEDISKPAAEHAQGAEPRPFTERRHPENAEQFIPPRRRRGEW